MILQKIVAPEVEIPVPDGIVEACRDVDVLVEEPGVDGSEHGGDGVSVAEGKGVAEVLVVGERVGGSVADNPPGVRAPEEAAVGADGTVHVERGSQVGEAEAAVEVEGGDDLAADVPSLAEAAAIADECPPIGALRPGVEVDAGSKVVAQTILEGGVGLLMVDARTRLHGRIAVHLAVAHGSGEIGNLGEGMEGKEHPGEEGNGSIHSFGNSRVKRQPSW